MTRQLRRRFGLLAIAAAGVAACANNPRTGAPETTAAAWPMPACPADFPTVEQTLAWRAKVNAARALTDPVEQRDAMAALISESLEGSGIELNVATNTSPNEIAVADFKPTPAVNYDHYLNHKTSFRFTPETNVRSLRNNGGYYLSRSGKTYIILGPKVIDLRGPGFIREYTEHELFHANHHVGDRRPQSERELEAWTYQFRNWFHRKYPYRMVWNPLIEYYSDSGPEAQKIALDAFIDYYNHPPSPPVAPQCVDETRTAFREWVEQRLADSQTSSRKLIRDLQEKLNIGVDQQANAAAANTYWLYWVGAGDLNADGRDEVLRWDNHRKAIVIYEDSAGTPVEIAQQPFEHAPVRIAIADLDGDARNELIIGEGLDNYNPKDGPQQDVVIRIYKPLEPNGWTPVEVYRAVSERPTVTALDVTNFDNDPEPEIIFSYYASKYMVDFEVADRDASGAWQVTALAPIRMGSAMAIGQGIGGSNRAFVVGRAYGDETAESRAKKRPPLGDAFVLQDGKRTMLPVHRGVSSVAVGDVDGDNHPDIVVGDGWHSDYGKVARGRLALLQDRGGKWTYEFIEDVPDEMRVTHIELTDINDDGKDEIVAQGESRTPFKSSAVRIYRKSADGWRKAIVADSAKSFVLADVDGDGRDEVVVAGPDAVAHSMDEKRLAWTTDLFPAVETFLNNPDELIGQPASELIADEWVNGEPVTLASLRNKVVLLDYWATWCGPCIAAFPGLKRLKTIYGPAGFTIIGVTNHSQQTSEDVRKLVAAQRLTWPTAIDAASRTHMNYGVQNLPHQIIIDRNGIIRSYYVGGGESLNAIEQDIRKLLAEPQQKGS